MKKQIGVLNEQGFAAGQFGFNPLNEQEQKKVQDKPKNDKPSK